MDGPTNRKVCQLLEGKNNLKDQTIMLSKNISILKDYLNVFDILNKQNNFFLKGHKKMWQSDISHDKLTENF